MLPWLRSLPVLPSTQKRGIMRWGIAAQCALSMVWVIVLVTFITTVLDIQRQRATFMREVEERGFLLASTLNDILANPLYFYDVDELNDLGEVVTGQPDVTYVHVFLPDGRLLVESQEHDYAVGVTSDFGLSAFRDRQTVFRRTGDILEFASPIEIGGDVIGGIRFGFNSDSLEARIRDVTVQRIWQALALIFVGIAISILLAQSFVRPILRLVGATQKLGEGEFEAPVDVRLNNEIGELGRAFAEMGHRLGTMTSNLRTTNEQLQFELAERRWAEAELQQAKDELEVRVEQRTTEISGMNKRLHLELTERQRAEQKLKELHTQLLDASHQAGMAELATAVLHDIGNAVNSVGVSATLIGDKLQRSKVTSLKETAQLLHQHRDDLGTFLTNDSKGSRIPAFLSALSEHLLTEQAELVHEAGSLTNYLVHIKTIISSQQTYARGHRVTEVVALGDVINMALQLSSVTFERQGIRVTREYINLPPVTVDRNRLLRILINLLSNARRALDDSDREDKVLEIRIAKNEGHEVEITVSDNGVGILEENLTRIFEHGFTTKQDGNGFGLHSSANAAKEIGGSLTCRSDGPHTGTTFTLKLPYRPQEMTV